MGKIEFQKIRTEEVVYDITERERRRKTTVFSQLFLTVGIVVVLLGLALYGIMLKTQLYSYVSGGSDNVIALAIVEISEGIFPWNFMDRSPRIIAERNNFLLGAENENVQLFASNIEKADDMDTSGGYGQDQNYPNGSQSYVSGNAVSGAYATLEGSDIESDNEDIQNTVNNSDALDVVNEQDTVAEVLEQEEVVMAEDVTSTDEPKQAEFITVDDSYFDDAVFLGDSRMVGVCYYAGMSNATYYAKTSMTVYKMLDGAQSTDPSVASAREGLLLNQFKKVYIMVGINEIGTGDMEHFVEAYSAMIEEIKEMQPDAYIYIQGIMHVSERRSKKDKYINNTNINERNAALAQLADNERIFYIDVNPVYDDANGNLGADYTGDDCHLYGKCYDAWHQFFLENAVEYNNTWNADGHIRPLGEILREQQELEAAQSASDQMIDQPMDEPVNPDIVE